MIAAQWVTPLKASSDPLTTISTEFERGIEVLLAQQPILGCPLNNLAKEMNPLDAGFRARTTQVSRPGATATTPRRRMPADPVPDESARSEYTRPENPARSVHRPPSATVRGRPKCGNTPGSNRVMALIRSPARPSTSSPLAWAISVRGSRT
jgi:hypothetical protein